jgi:hypothetical protein
MKTFSAIRHPSDDICRSFYGSDARSDQSFSLASGPVYARELERTINLQNRMQVKNIMSQNVEVVLLRRRPRKWRRLTLAHSPFPTAIV